MRQRRCATGTSATSCTLLPARNAWRGGTWISRPSLPLRRGWRDPFGYPLVALRALPILAAALTVYVAARLAAELAEEAIRAGVGRGRDAAHAGLSAARQHADDELARAALLDAGDLRCDTNRARIGGATRRCGGWCSGVVMAAGCYAKYSMLLPVVGVVVGLLLTPERRALRSPFVLYAAALAAVLLAPNLVWQASHGWPFVEVLRGDAAHRPAFAVGIALEYRNLWQNFKAFAIEQLVYTNPVAAIVWVTGSSRRFVARVARSAVCFRWVCGGVCGRRSVCGERGTTSSGITPRCWRSAAVATRGLRVPLRAAVFGLLVAVGVVACRSRFRCCRSIRSSLTRSASDSPGAAARRPTSCSRSLPRSSAGIGWRVTLPASTSRCRSWCGAARRSTPTPTATPARSTFSAPLRSAAGDFEPEQLLFVGLSGLRGLDAGRDRRDADRSSAPSTIAASSLVRTSTEPYKWIVEGPAPIYLCRDPVLPLRDIWPNLRWYGA